MKVSVQLDIEKEIIDIALRKLRYQDMNPEVGMGFRCWTMAQQAIEELEKKFNIEIASKVDLKSISDRIDKIYYHRHR